MISNTKRVFTSLLTLIFAFSFFAQTGAASTIEDGTYQISFDGMHITENTLSASDSMGSLIKPANLEVSNGKITAFITVSGSPLKQENSAGDMVPAELVKENGKQKTYKFTLANLDKPIVVGTHVAQVGIDVEYRIVFKKDTLKKVSDDVSSPISTSTPNPQTGDAIYSTLSGLAVIMVLLLTATVVMNKRKATQR